MMVSVKAIAEDGKVLGERVFDFADKAQRQSEVNQLVNHVYMSAPDPLSPVPFTLKFDKVE